MVIEIKLTQGKIAIVDDIDGDLAKISWCAVHEGKYNINWYARSTHSLRKRCAAIKSDNHHCKSWALDTSMYCYCHRNYRNENMKPQTIPRAILEHKARHNLHLHRIILERMLGRPLERGECADHANHNGLDNRRANLRVCRGGENQRNKGILNRTKTGSGKGYYWNKKNKKWQASFAPGDGTRKHIGCFDTEGEAREAYDIVVKKYYGEYAYTNADAVRDGFIEKIETPERIEIETLRPLEQRIRIPPWKQSSLRKALTGRITAMEEA